MMDGDTRDILELTKAADADLAEESGGICWPVDRTLTELRQSRDRRSDDSSARSGAPAPAGWPGARVKLYSVPKSN